MSLRYYLLNMGFYCKESKDKFKVSNLPIRTNAVPAKNQGKELKNDVPPLYVPAYLYIRI